MDRRKNRAVVILTKVKEKLAHGWVRGAWRTKDVWGQEHRCLVQTIACAIAEMDGKEEINGAQTLMYNREDHPDSQLLLPALGFRDWEEAVSFNDEHGRNTSEVIERVDQAIEKSLALVE